MAGCAFTSQGQLKVWDEEKVLQRIITYKKQEYVVPYFNRQQCELMLTLTL